VHAVLYLVADERLGSLEKRRDEEFFTKDSWRDGAVVSVDHQWNSVKAMLRLGRSLLLPSSYVQTYPFGGGAHVNAAIKWLDEPSQSNYPAAQSYLTLVFSNAAQIVERLKTVEVTQFKAKDIFRASGLSLLGVSNSHVKKDLSKIADGKALSPILLVRREGEKVVIADGYHRLCAVYSLDEDASIPCKIVTV